MVAFVAIIGLILGSFINVVICRLSAGLSLVSPRSHCFSCKKPIRCYDNIPVLSYLVLKGRCRDCGSRISWRYPLVEGLTALCLLALFLRYEWSVHFLTYGILILFLIPVSFIDLDKGLILNKLTIPCCILGISLVLGLQIESWKEVLLGAVGGGGIGLLIGWMGKRILHKESFGMGDVKLLVMIGVYVGFPGVVICLFFGALVAAVFIFGGMIRKKMQRNDTIPFGPFIAGGTLVYLLWGGSILGWYLGWF